MYFKSVTFDLDGTLLDTVADLHEACQRMLAELEMRPRSIEEINCFVGKGMAVLVERCLTYDVPPAADQLAAGIASFQRHYATVNGDFAAIYPGVLEGLQAWKNSGAKMAVVTNKPAQFTQSLLKRTDLLSYFSVIVSGDTTAHKKPHPEPILHACRELGVEPGFNLHIGDSKHDIHSAHAAGCQAYAVPYGYNEGQPVDSADCDAIVSDLFAAYQQALTFKDLTKK